MIKIPLHLTERDRWSGTLEPVTREFEITLLDARWLVNHLNSAIVIEESRISKEKEQRIQELESELKSLKGET